MGDLTDKQRLFVEHYVVCLNGAEAARRAGYAAGSARQIASENLSKPDIRAAIDAKLAESAMQPAEILARLTDHARGSMGDFLVAHGRGVRLDLKRAADAGQLHLIKKYTKTKGGYSIELYDAHAALVKLGEHRRLWVQRQEVSGPHGGPIEVHDARSQLATALTSALAAGDAGAASSGDCDPAAGDGDNAPA